MHPEAVAHDHSAHARVSCVECHVGSGASWYVKSKLSGVRQVVKTISNTYPRPIETPVANLRPASQTCEQCHWPRRFWGAQLKVFNHFASDEANTPRQVRLLIKTGGGDPNLGSEAAGIHWHMNIANKIEYKSDPKRQNISWVRRTDRNGNVTEYTAAGADRSYDRQTRAAPHGLRRLPQSSHARLYAAGSRRRSGLGRQSHQHRAAVCQAAGRADSDRRSTRPPRRRRRPSPRRFRPSTRRSIPRWPRSTAAISRTW